MSNFSMSTQETRKLIVYVRHSRKRKMLDVDLNVPPSTLNMVHAEQRGTSAHTASQVGINVQHEGSMPPLIDVEAFDDDVVISSLRAFVEARAKNNSRRNRGRTVIIDLESEGQSTRVSPHNLINRGVPSNQNMNSDCIMIVEGSSKPVLENARSITMPPPPKEPALTCPVCMGPFVEEMSTKCGHIFCKKCIRASIAFRGKCPACRGKISMKNTIRVYLPTAN